ncbi:MAG: NAD(P)/FAD-dependent oxidoreductase [Phycisphaerales bacterium]
MSIKSDVVVVGAGIVGAACAHELARAGKRVTVIDAGLPGMVATAAGMGHIVVMDDTPAIAALTLGSRKAWDALAPRLPQSAVYTRPGTAWIAENEGEMDLVRAKHQFFASVGIEAQVLGPSGLAACEPNLRQGLCGALVVPGDAVVFAPAAAAWLIEQTVALGGAFVTGAAVVALSGTTARLSDGRVFEGHACVNAAGASAPLLTPGLPIRPRKGHLVMTESAPGFCRHELIELGYLTSAHGHAEETVAFNVQPRATGQVLIGASRQYSSPTGDIEPRIVEQMLRRCEQFMPGLAGLRHAQTWTGFRPASVDSLPLIGPYPAEPGLYIAAGHEGLGITTALSTGMLIGDHILGRSPTIDPRPYLPGRFALQRLAAL